jgi:hypothetical protein
MDQQHQGRQHQHRQPARSSQSRVLLGRRFGQAASLQELLQLLQDHAAA